MINSTTSMESQKTYQTIASWYDLLDYYWEKRRYNHAREMVWAQVKGKRILDAGVGTGRNIPFYPKNRIVDSIDLSLRMIEKAKERAELLGVHPRFQEMEISNLRYLSRTFDSVVSTFVLCVLPPEKERATVKELHRVLKAGGILLLLDYTYSSHTLRNFIQKACSPLIFALYGTRLDNPTLDVVSHYFTIERVEFLHADTLRMIIARK